MLKLVYDGAEKERSLYAVVALARITKNRKLEYLGISTGLFSRQISAGDTCKVRRFRTLLTYVAVDTYPRGVEVYKGESRF